MTLQRVRRTLLFFSFMFFSITFMYLSPYLAVVGTAYRTVASGLAFWALVMVTAPLLGRSMCGYLCPLGGLQDCLHDGLQKPLVRVRFLKALKYVIWAMWVGAICAIAVAKHGWASVNLLFHNERGLPPYAPESYVYLFGFMLLAAIPAMLLGRRGFCHYLCFFSPLNIIGERLGRRVHLPALRVRVSHHSACNSCRLCDKACPMSLGVSKMVERGAVDDAECIACGSCSAACKSGALAYGISVPSNKRVSSRKREAS